MSEPTLDRERLARQLSFEAGVMEMGGTGSVWATLMRAAAAALRLPVPEEIEAMAKRLEQEAYIDKHNAAGNKTWLASAAALLRRCLPVPRQGAEEMRERAAMACQQLRDEFMAGTRTEPTQPLSVAAMLAAAIRAMPLSGDKP